MSSGSPMKIIRWVTISSLMGTLLAGCSTPYHPAPITSIDDSNSGSSSISAPVDNSESRSISTPMPSRTRIQSDNTQTISSEQSSSTSHSVNQAAERDQSGRIVYNRNYENIPKGSYNGSTYTVAHGDTLFYIAWITGADFRDLASNNDISAPYSLSEGQVIRINTNGVNASQSTNNTTVIATNQNSPQSRVVDSQPTNAYSDNSGSQPGGKMLSSQASSAGRASGSATTATTTTTAVASASATSPVTSTTKAPTAASGTVKWIWPVEGKVIEGYTGPTSGNRGIDIGGSRGQPIYAASAGKVVYTGNALRGYGNLIIIKHNDDYLSAYAHNDTILVRDQQDVAAGQKIATMGSSGTSSVRLHFEVRYKGKSVNPLQYLPQR